MHAMHAFAQKSVRQWRGSVNDSPRFIGVAPAINGTPVDGTSIDLTAITSYGSPTVSIAYQWKLDGSNISSATSAAYTPVVDDRAHTLTCSITLTSSASGTTPATYTTAGVVVTSSGGTGSILADWAAPIYLGDGVTLAAGSIIGYTVYWDTTPGMGADAANSHFVSGESTLNYTIPGLSAGTYYVSVSARTVDGDGPTDNERPGVTVA